MLRQCHDISCMQIGDSSIHSTDKAKNIGVMFDENLNFVNHVNLLCRTCYMHLNNISKIREYLSKDAAATIVNALVTSRLDNVNAILYGLTQYLIQRMQRVQNNAARLVCRKKKRDNVTPLLKELHWLPVKHRIEYKIAMLVFKCLHNLAPQYLCDLIERYEPQRSLRSANKNIVVEKPGKQRIGDRAFKAAGPKVWNELPDSIRNLNELSSFKVALKTHHFDEAFK